MEKLNSGFGCGAAIAIVMLLFALVAYAIPATLQNSAREQARMYAAKADYVESEGVADVLHAGADSVRADTEAAHGWFSDVAPFVYVLSGLFAGSAPAFVLLYFERRRSDEQIAIIVKMIG